MCSEGVSAEGQILEIPVNYNCVNRRNNYDGSGPANVGLQFAVNNRTRRLVIPVYMSVGITGGTCYTRLEGSRSFTIH